MNNNVSKNNTQTNKSQKGKVENAFAAGLATLGLLEKDV
jgi:hypothetical protein